MTFLPLKSLFFLNYSLIHSIDAHKKTSNDIIILLDYWMIHSVLIIQSSVYETIYIVWFSDVLLCTAKQRFCLYPIFFFLVWKINIETDAAYEPVRNGILATVVGIEK